MKKFIILTIIISSLTINILGCEEPLKEDFNKIITAISNNDLDTIKAVYKDHEYEISLTRNLIKLMNRDTPMNMEIRVFLNGKIRELRIAYISLKKSRPHYKGPLSEWPELGLLLDPLVNLEGRLLDKDGKKTTKDCVFDAEWSRINAPLRDSRNSML